MLRVFQPQSFVITPSESPARRMSRAVDRRRSWMMASGRSARFRACFYPVPRGVVGDRCAVLAFAGVAGSRMTCPSQSTMSHVRLRASTTREPGPLGATAVALANAATISLALPWGTFR